MQRYVYEVGLAPLKEAIGTLCTVMEGISTFLQFVGLGI